MVIDSNLMQMLELLKVVDAVDSITVNADTKYEMNVVWNPNMNGGEYEGFIKDSGYEQYWSADTVEEMVEIINPMYLRIIEWIPQDWEDRWDIAKRLADELWNNQYHWHTVTDDVIAEYARQLGYYD
jgi:hypothetical protein